MRATRPGPGSRVSSHHGGDKNPQPTPVDTQLSFAGAWAMIEQTKASMGSGKGPANSCADAGASVGEDDRREEAMGAKVEKERLDKLMVERGLCETRAKAQALIMAGQVVVAGHRAEKSGQRVAVDVEIRVKGEGHRFVSRGGLKLDGALTHFATVQPPGPLVEGRVVMDVGASTGGFSDCVLQRGAARVYAVDVGYGQLAWRLAQDPRVVVLDRTNIRTLDAATVPDPIELVVADCSFISLTKVLPALPSFLAARAELVVLVKPQFEVGPQGVGKGGIVRDEALQSAALRDVETHAADLGFEVVDRCDSPIFGQKGNREFLLWLRWVAAETAHDAPAGV